MKLDDKDFKRFKQLEKLVKSKKATDAEVAEFEALKAKKLASNDRIDYIKSDQLAHDVGTIYQSELYGTRITSNELKVEPTQIIRVVYEKVVDSVAKATNGISLAARDFYSYIRSGQSGATNYQGVDIEMVIQAEAEVVDWINWFKRLYRVANTYEKLNFNWPNKVFAAICGSNTLLPEVLKNMADFRARVNVMVREVSSFSFPSDMPFMHVRKHLTSNVFKDKDGTERCQLFLYTPESVLTYNETKYSTGGCLERVSLHSVLGKGQSTIDNYNELIILMDYVESIIDYLKSSNTITTMNGDIYRKYEKEGKLDLLYKFEELHDLDFIEPIYDQHIFERLRNSVFNHGYLVGDIVQYNNVIWNLMIGGPNPKAISGYMTPTTDQWRIGTPIPDTGVQQSDANDRLVLEFWQKDNTLAPNFYIYNYDNRFECTALREFIFNTDKYPDVDMNVEATRHTILYDRLDVNSFGDYYTHEITHGSEVIVGMYFIDSRNIAPFSHTYIGSNIDVDTSGDFDSFSTVSKMEQFAATPTLYYMNEAATPSDYNAVQYIGVELSEYCVIHYTTLARLNKICLLTEFSVESIASWLK